MKLNLKKTIYTAQWGNEPTKIALRWDVDYSIKHNIDLLWAEIQNVLENESFLLSLKIDLRYSVWYSDFNVADLDKIVGSKVDRFKTGKYTSDDGSVTVCLGTMEGRAVDMLDVSFPGQKFHIINDLFDAHVPRYSHCSFEIKIGQCLFVIEK